MTHYLKAVEATKTDDADKVIAKMKATQINDFFAKNGRSARRWPPPSTTCT